MQKQLPRDQWDANVGKRAPPEACNQPGELGFDGRTRIGRGV